MKYEIASIPAVKAFKDGEVVAEFIGAVPPARIEAFLNEIVPSEADRLAESGDEESLRKALELDPGHAQAAIGLSRLLLSRGEDEEALEVLKPFPHDFVADGLAARAELSASANGAGADELQRAFAAWDDGDPGEALEQLQGVLASEQDAQRKDQLRRVMVAIFTELGADHPLAREHRRRLAAALNCSGGRLLAGHGDLDRDPERLGLLDPLALLVARADDAEGAGAELGVGDDRQAADLLPAEPLALEGVHADLAGGERAVRVVLVDRPRDRLEVLGL